MPTEWSFCKAVTSKHNFFYICPVWEANLGSNIQVIVLKKLQTLTSIQHNDSQHNDTHHSNTQHNDTHHSNTQHNNIIFLLTS